MNKAAQIVKTINQYWNGSFNSKDNHRYFSYYFTVPETAFGIRATVRYYGQGNYLGLGLYNSGRLQAYGRAKKKNDKVVLTAQLWADLDTPGSVAGAILPGTWQVEICTNEIKGFCPFDIHVEIWPGRFAPIKPRSLAPRPEKINCTPGWYIGDLHVHSTDSDGTKSSADLFGIAAEKELNFLAITDHNNIFNWRKLPGNTQGVLPLPAMEVTTFHGHANAFGIVDWVDWRTGQNGRTINEIADIIHQLGGIFSVNHPCTPGLPDAHACWRHQDFDWQKADAVEIWNAPVFSGGEDANRQCRTLWDSLLNRGLRITGVGGSDAHYLGGGGQPMALPLNYLYLAELSRVEVLHAIKQGRVFVTRGPEIYFCALSRTRHALPGGTLERGRVRLAAMIHCRGTAPLILTVIKNGVSLKKVTVPQDTFSYNLNTNAMAGDWFRLELTEEKDGDERLAAFTNPVYIG